MWDAPSRNVVRRVGNHSRKLSGSCPPKVCGSPDRIPEACRAVLEAFKTFDHNKTIARWEGMMCAAIFPAESGISSTYLSGKARAAGL